MVLRAKSICEKAERFVPGQLKIFSKISEANTKDQSGSLPNKQSLKLLLLYVVLKSFPLILSEESSRGKFHPVIFLLKKIFI